jgi:hypothetical protein
MNCGGQSGRDAHPHMKAALYALVAVQQAPFPSWEELFLNVLVSCHLRRKVVEFASNHE